MSKELKEGMRKMSRQVEGINKKITKKKQIEVLKLKVQ